MKIPRIFIPLLGFCLLAGSVSSQEQKPNILLIIMDDLNTCVGAYGGPAITPNIDRLSSEGLTFMNAYSACPSCNPSRTSMLTGQRPERTGVFSNSQPFRETEPGKHLTTLPQLLKANGYNTISAGKIFHNRRGNRQEPSPLSDPVSWTYQASIDAELYFGHNFKEKFQDENGVPKWVTRANGYADEEAKKKIKGNWSYGPIDVPATRTLDFNTAEFGAAFLLKDNTHPQVAPGPDPDRKPFFLACGIFRPHIPIICPREFFELYTIPENKPRLELPEFPEDDLADLPEAAKRGEHWFVKYMKPFPEEQVHLRHAYYAATSYGDAAVGIILDALGKSDFADNTIVIFMGDQGYQLGEKDRIGKSVVWKGSSGIPMVIKVPGKDAGSTEEAVSLIDLYPTLLELTGIDPVHELDGESLVPLIEDPTHDRKTPVVITNAGSGSVVSVVSDKWHYISYYEGGEELYDHSRDPKEEINLLWMDNSTKKYRKIADELSTYIPENRRR